MSIRMRHTRGHTRNRRSHHALKQTNIITDKETGTLRLPHHIDEATGMYRGKQIFAAKVKKVSGKKVKGASTEPAAPHVHDHAHDHANAETKPQAKGLKGVIGKLATGGKPKARSGFGGGA
jgi:large subunit ribosomal protein L32